jgi:hypothetical protein
VFLKKCASKTPKKQFFVGPESQLIFHDGVKVKLTWLCIYFFRQLMAHVKKSRSIIKHLSVNNNDNFVEVRKIKLRLLRVSILLK